MAGQISVLERHRRGEDPAAAQDPAAPLPAEHAVLPLFRALADPSRLRLLALLRDHELAVGELAQLLAQSQPRVSRHIRILEDAGLVERRREGGWVFVRLSRSARVRALAAFVDQLPLSRTEAAAVARDRQRLVAVQAEREAAAARYFAAHAEEWDAIRSLHVAEEGVEAAIVALLAAAPVGRLLDVGTGTGRMAAILGGGASRVTAIDRSPEMLRVARSRLAGVMPGGPAVELVQGDFMALPLAAASVDTVVMHQVLHYARRPDLVIAEAARVLAEGGRLLIVDFAAHDREELRREAAHVRLGFADDAIAGWFAAAGLALDRTQSLDGGALTVRLWLGRRLPVHQPGPPA